MSKLVKILLGVVAAVVLLVIAAVIVLPMVIDPNDYKADIVKAVRDETGRELVISEPLELSVFPWLGINAGGVSLSNAAGFGNEPFASLGALNLKVKLLPLLTGSVQVDTIVIRDLSLNLARNAKGVSNWDDLAGDDKKPAEAEKPSEGGGKLAVDIQGIELINARLVWDDRQAKSRYELKDLNLTAGALTAGNTAPLSLGLALDTGETGPKVSVALKGTVSVRDDSLGYTMPDLNLVVDAQGGDLPAPLKLNLDAKLALDLAAGSLGLSDLKAKVDDSTLTGKVSVGSFAGPAVQLALNLDQIDLDRYLPAPAEGEQAKAETKPAAKASDDPLAGLRTLDLDGQVRIGKLKVKNLNIQDVQLTVRAKNGVLKADPLQALLYEGKLSAKAEVDARKKTPSIKVKQNLTGVQAGPLLLDLVGNDRLIGVGEVSADLSMRGLDDMSIRKSLNGTAQFAFRDGAVKGVNVAELIRNAQARLSGGATSEGPQQTDFSELSGSATIRNGLVDNRDLLAKSPLLRIDGKGQVDLPADNINYLLTTELVTSLQGQGGKDDLAGVPIPVRIKGKLAEPGFSVDLQSVMQSKLKQEAENKLKDKAGDKVKGLLKGFGF